MGGDVIGWLSGGDVIGWLRGDDVIGKEVRDDMIVCVIVLYIGKLCYDNVNYKDVLLISILDPAPLHLYLLT